MRRRWPAPLKITPPVATSTIEVRATLTALEPFGSKDWSAVVMAVVRSASTLLSANVLMATPDIVSTPATTAVPGVAEADAATGGCCGAGEGDTPEAPHTVSAVGEQMTRTTGVAPLQVEQRLQRLAPGEAANVTPA